MSKPHFISGQWTGYYAYQSGHPRYRMGLGLRFGQGRIVGDGQDAIGGFVIRGRYDLPTREVWWSKGYIGNHEVHYSGLRVGKAIQGIWATGQHATGEFRIWPVGHGDDGEEVGEIKEVEKPMPEISVAIYVREDK